MDIAAPKQEADPAKDETAAPEEDSTGEESQDDFSITSSDRSSPFVPSPGHSDSDKSYEGEECEHKESPTQLASLATMLMKPTALPKKRTVKKAPPRISKTHVTPKPRSVYPTPSKSPKSIVKPSPNKRKAKLSPAFISPSPRAAKRVNLSKNQAKKEDIDEAIGKDESTDSDDSE